MTNLNLPSEGSSLAAWLSFIEELHGGAAVMDFGLDRMKEMIARMGIAFRCPVFTVGGTNGKGSTCAFLERILREAGLRVGMHTSPHMLRFEERAFLLGREATEDELVRAFSRVEAARGGLILSYFEYTALAILSLFAESEFDAVVLEIGLGGRLDAINAIDPTVSVVTSIGLDHTAYLGPDRESIGREKAFIYRPAPGHAAVCADDAPPKSLLAHAGTIGADLRVAGRDFRLASDGKGNFVYEGRKWRLEGLPRPGLAGSMQLANAAGAIAALEAADELGLRLPVTREVIVKGLERARITGRFDLVSRSPAIVLDAGHNPHAARSLLRNMKESAPEGREIAVCGMLRDKDRKRVGETLKDAFDLWVLSPLGGPRGETAEELREEFLKAGITEEKIVVEKSVACALDAAVSRAAPADRIIAFGSFVTVSEAIEALRGRGLPVEIVP